MLPYTLRRLGQAVVVIWAAYTLTFVILYLLPGDPVSILVLSATQEETTLDPAQVEALRREWGLDQPLPVQYVGSLWDALHLDFGLSYETREPAVQRVLGLLPQTLVLGASALVIAIIGGTLLAIGITFGPWAGGRRLLAALPPIGVSVPGFWIGLLLIQFFAFRLGWFPPMGTDGVDTLVLPALSMAIPTGASIAQLLSRSLELTLQEPYVSVIRSRGAGGFRIFARALRNAVLPVLTMVGMMVGHLFAGAAITETVFSRDGIGSLTVNAVSQYDGPVLQLVVLVVSGIFVLSSLVTDLLYPLVDPRIVLERSKGVAV